ncbi:MAG: CheR family methyltransferase, partial [Chloroflexota bacterium]
FFRNANTFQQLAKLVLPDLLADKKKRGQRNISFWSAACAFGEEPYSIAIMLIESLGKDLQEFDISIDATDISQQVINRAQSARYKNTEGLSGNLLNRYFKFDGGCYVAEDRVRRMVEFSCFNLLSNSSPLLKNADCIFCCNILIYMQKQLQERVLDLLCHSLAIPGYLILGEAETLTENLCSKLECLDTKAKIYKRRE